MSQLVGCDRCRKTAEGSITRPAHVEKREGKEPEIRYGEEQIYVREAPEASKAVTYDATKGWRFVRLPANGSECTCPSLLICPVCVQALHDFFKDAGAEIKPKAKP